MRKDVQAQNDSGGLSLISSAAMDRVIEDNRENDQAFAEAHEVVRSQATSHSSRT